MADNVSQNQVSISSADRNPNFLSPKFQAGNGISLTDNGNFIRIDALGSNGDHKVAVDIDDNNPNYLSSKLEAGSGINLADTGSTIKIDAVVQTGDHKVCVDSADSSPDYLENKISAGANVSLTNTGSAVQVSATDTIWPDPMTTEGDIVYENSSLQPARLGIGTNGQVLTVDSGIPSWQNIPTQTGDHKVLVDSSDTNPQYLGVKLKSGAGVNISYYNHDKMEIAALGQVKVNLLGTMDYLENKLIQGSGITLTKTNNDITIAADTQTGDHKVSTDGTDTANYLENKIEAGTNVSVTKSSGKLIISSTDTGMLNPMTAKGDLISGGVSGNPIRLPVGNAGEVLTSIGSDVAWTELPGYVKVGSSDTSPDYLGNKLVQGSGITLTTGVNTITIAADTQTGDHKVLASNSDTDPAGYLDSKISFSSPLIATGSNNLSVSIDYGQDGQILGTEGTTVKWVNAPKRIDWSIETALLNGTFNQTLDRTFYVEVFPECSFSSVDSVVAVLRNANSGDEWRAAVYDNNRNMVYYGTSTGTNANFRKITLTKLADFDFDANNVFFLALSQHTAGSSSSQIATATVTSPFYCWYEDHVLESGRAMPANTSLTAVSGKVPAIGLRGR